MYVRGYHNWNNISRSAGSLLKNTASCVSFCLCWCFQAERVITRTRVIFIAELGGWGIRREGVPISYRMRRVVEQTSAGKCICANTFELISSTFVHLISSQGLGCIHTMHALAQFKPKHVQEFPTPPIPSLHRAFHLPNCSHTLAQSFSTVAASPSHSSYACDPPPPSPQHPAS